MSYERAAALDPGLERRPHSWLLLIWVAAAFLSTLCGIGGGLFAVPMLHYLGGLRLQRAVGTSLVLVFVLAGTATIAEAARPDSAIQLHAAGCLIAGCVFGTRVGFAVAMRVRTRALKLCFVVVLAIAGTRVLLSPEGASVAHGSFHMTVHTVAIVTGIGFCGGFLSPLLGIGGGMVVVPMLFLLLPSFGYLEARANSMAMSVVSSALSARLHLREGNVHIPSAAWFAASAVVGAVLGVTSVHLQGWAGAARIAMGVVLLLVAARFARDVLARVLSDD